VLDELVAKWDYRDQQDRRRMKVMYMKAVSPAHHVSCQRSSIIVTKCSGMNRIDGG
jgi:hypothetical protein